MISKYMTCAKLSLQWKREILKKQREWRRNVQQGQLSYISPSSSFVNENSFTFFVYHSKSINVFIFFQIVMNKMVQYCFPFSLSLTLSVLHSLSLCFALTHNFSHSFALTLTLRFFFLYLLFYFSPWLVLLINPLLVKQPPLLEIGGKANTGRGGTVF